MIYNLEHILKKQTTIVKILATVADISEHVLIDNNSLLKALHHLHNYKLYNDY